MIHVYSDRSHFSVAISGVALREMTSSTAQLSAKVAGAKLQDVISHTYS